VFRRNDMQSEILLSDARGQYIPRDFAEIYGDLFTYEGTPYGMNYTEAIASLLDGPESEDYWDVWLTVVDNAKYIKNPDMILVQDGDVFLMTPDDYERYSETIWG
jgi:hypothetical protein